MPPNKVEPLGFSPNSELGAPLFPKRLPEVLPKSDPPSAGLDPKRFPGGAPPNKLPAGLESPPNKLPAGLDSPPNKLPVGGLPPKRLPLPNAGLAGALSPNN